MRWPMLWLGLMIGIFGKELHPAELSGEVPNKNTPRKLQEAWLEFHKTDLCQEIDAVFIFCNDSMEIWSRIENEKHYQKFQALFEPLKVANSVALYTTRAEPDKKKDEDDPPPSLWQNIELRRNLGEYAPAIAGLSMKQALQFPRLTRQSDFAPFLNQRLRIYSEQVLDWSKKTERYSKDLVALMRVAHDPEGFSDLKPKAIAVAQAHAQNMEKILRKLKASLEQAFPSADRKKRTSSRPAKPVIPAHDALEKAVRISSAAQSISQRVYNFIFPENHTVKLDELRNPSLLESLSVLREMTSDFEKSLGRSAKQMR